MMKPIKLLPALLPLILLFSCQPKPLEIEVKQSEPQLTVSSAAPDEHTVVVSAGYSINSMVSLGDTVNGGVDLPDNMLLEDGIVTLAAEGRTPDTLYPIASGLYANRNMQLEKGASYTLTVYDHNKGLAGVATTPYFPLPAIDSLSPEVTRKHGDTLVTLHLKLSGAGADDFYFVSYNTAAAERVLQRSPYALAATLAAFSPKQLTLLSAADIKNGCIRRAIPLGCKGTDTLLVHTGKIDKAYFDYLTAYKKSGSLINQLTGEPINLPTNIATGLGFFSLSTPVRSTFYLKHY